MERLESLGLLVDWERGKVYRDRGPLGRVLMSFGIGLEEVRVDEDLTRRIVEDRIRRIYERATSENRREFSTDAGEGQIRLVFHPDRIRLEGPRYEVVHTPSEVRVTDKETGEVQRRPADLKTFGEFYRGVRELMDRGYIETYSPSGLLGLGGGLLAGLILSEMIHHAFHEDQEIPPDPSEDFEFFDDFDMV
jgi:hypothetical protein